MANHGALGKTYSKHQLLQIRMLVRKNPKEARIANNAISIAWDMVEVA